MSQSASSKAPALSMLGRKSYVSQRGLESALTDLKASGLLADDVTSSRSSIKRAREEDLASLTGVFGPLVQKMEVPADGQCKKTVVVPYIHPAAFLKHVFSLAPLWDFLRQEVLPHKETPSYARPWGLIFYADEVTPAQSQQFPQDPMYILEYIRTWKSRFVVRGIMVSINLPTVAPVFFHRRVDVFVAPHASTVFHRARHAKRHGGGHS